MHDSALIEEMAKRVHHRRAGRSIAAVAGAVDTSLAGVFIALGDMPEVLVNDYRLLASRFTNGAMAAPLYNGVRAHPVLFCSTSFQRCVGGGRARSILKRRAGRFIEVVTDIPGVLRDVDTPGTSSSLERCRLASTC
jgi:CTP:molybdopterin cytidylyltransferase MocA